MVSHRPGEVTALSWRAAAGITAHGAIARAGSACLGHGDTRCPRVRGCCIRRGGCRPRCCVRPWPSRRSRRQWSGSGSCTRVCAPSLSRQHRNVHGPGRRVASRAGPPDAGVPILAATSRRASRHKGWRRRRMAGLLPGLPGTGRDRPEAEPCGNVMPRDRPRDHALARTRLAPVPGG